MGCVYDIKLPYPEAFTWYFFHHDYKVITYEGYSYLR